MPLTKQDAISLLRWRLMLGSDVESGSSGVSLADGELLSVCPDAVGVDGEKLATLDRCLHLPYGSHGADLSASRPYIPQWLGAIREFFSAESVGMIQKDAVDKGLTQLLFEPETLPLLEKNVDLVATLVAAKHLIPDRAKDLARTIIADVVKELRKRFETKVKTAIVGAIRRHRSILLNTSQQPDWQRTIRSNLKGWDKQRKRLIPEKFYYLTREKKRREWDVIVLVDQSGSMANSVVYSSVMAAIFASIDLLQTHLVVFDTSVVDLTPVLSDPVEVLFSAQLGGGTDIHRAVAYAQENLVTRPKRTILLLITDLEEGGDSQALLKRSQQLVASGVHFLCALGLTDDAAPNYHALMANEMTRVGVNCFAATPDRLLDVMTKILQHPGWHDG